MLTPAFELSQDQDFLRILIKAKFAKVDDAEVHVDGDEFRFYSSPYYLRLSLPGRIVEDGRESAKYDTNTGYFDFKFAKESPGEEFEGLDMLTKLLAPKGTVCAAAPLIEVIGEENGTDGAEEPHYVEDSEEWAEDVEDEDDFDWQIEQEPYQDEASLLASNVKYGFANQRNGVFQQLREEFVGVIDLPDPDHTSQNDRTKLRKEDESDQFDDDYYLADLYQDDIIQQLIAYQPPWNQEYMKLQEKEKEGSDVTQHTIVELTEEEKDQLRKLPNKEYLIDKQTRNVLMLGLVDILFAYAYNHRTTEGENTVESAWTICKLSSTLSWLDSFSSLQDVVFNSYRRTLCYPLHRHWELACTVHHDVVKLFHLGRRRLLKCLLEVHHCLVHDDTRYILNDLYITDYCVWIQSLKSSTILSLAKKLSQVEVSKGDVDLDLDDLELAAKLVTNEEDNENAVTEGIENTTIHQYGYPHVLKEDATHSHDEHGSKENCCLHQSDGSVSDIKENCQGHQDCVKNDDNLAEQIAKITLEDDTQRNEHDTRGSETVILDNNRTEHTASGYSTSDSDGSDSETDSSSTTSSGFDNIQNLIRVVYTSPIIGFTPFFT
ncbi:protein SHQ1 homolog [Glandiceps talaboti]